MSIFEILDLRGCQNRKSHFWGEKKSAFTEKTIFGAKKVSVHQKPMREPEKYQVRTEMR